MTVHVRRAGRVVARGRLHGAAMASFLRRECEPGDWITLIDGDRHATYRLRQRGTSRWLQRAV